MTSGYFKLVKIQIKYDQIGQDIIYLKLIVIIDRLMVIKLYTPPSQIEYSVITYYR